MHPKTNQTWEYKHSHDVSKKMASCPLPQLLKDWKILHHRWQKAEPLRHMVNCMLNPTLEPATATWFTLTKSAFVEWPWPTPPVPLFCVRGRITFQVTRNHVLFTQGAPLNLRAFTSDLLWNPFILLILPKEAMSSLHVKSSKANSSNYSSNLQGKKRPLVQWRQDQSEGDQLLSDWIWGPLAGDDSCLILQACSNTIGGSLLLPC